MGALLRETSQTAFGFKDGRMHAPADVKAGLACACTCVGCGAILVAKKGQKNRWHFAHHNVEIGETCAESAIHAAAKQVLLDHNWMRVPGLTVEVSSRAKSGPEMYESTTLSEERTIRFERSAPEVWETDVRPDVVGYRGERRILVEMYFTHKVDAEKLRKIARLELPAIEVDLSDMDVSTGFDSITQRVVHDASHKSWLFFPNQEEERKRLRSKLARRIRLINSEQRTRDAAVRERRAAEERKLREAFTRRQEAARRYREMSVENKELDLRKRLGIIGRWPYYLQKASLDGNAIQEKPMIWQAALFARFVFKKANLSYDLDYKLVLSWVLERFDTGSNSIDSVSIEVKRYLAYLCACGFLRKLPVYRHKGQCYVVVHGELVPPKRVEESKKPPLQAPVPAEMVKPVRGQHEHWIWRASWPMWNDICEKAGELIAASSHGELLEALLHELSPFRRPDEPLECAAIMKVHGVSQAEVMSFLESLGLVLKSRLPGRDRPTNR